MKPLAIQYAPRRITGRILDIGCGNNALDIATHLVDRYHENNFERAGALDLPKGKEFKVGDIEAIPYPDGYFDFVHASHVLEHTSDLRKAIAELTRVAPSGYIETPAAAIEQGTIIPGEKEPGWSFHRWMVWAFPDYRKNPVLYAKPKTPVALHTVCSCRHGKAYSELISKINLYDLDPHLPYYCKMMQFLWTTPPRIEIWTENQTGRSGAAGSDRCRCAYSAFFAWASKYFHALPQIRRRWIFRRELPQIYQLVSGNKW